VQRRQAIIILLERRCALQRLNYLFHFFTGLQFHLALTPFRMEAPFG
jgi:hypothetical protein